MSREFNLKTKIYINAVPFDFEIFQVNEGVITSFKFDGRIFTDNGKSFKGKTEIENIKETPFEFTPEVISKQSHAYIPQGFRSQIIQDALNNIKEIFTSDEFKKKLLELHKNHNAPLPPSGLKAYTYRIFKQLINEGKIKRLSYGRFEKTKPETKQKPKSIKKEKVIEKVADEVIKEVDEKATSKVIKPVDSVVKPILLPGEKPIINQEKNFDWNKKRDEIIRDNFDELGPSGIFDKSLLPGFSLAEIRVRCQYLDLIDEYGNRTR
jgi:hypothetical protein